MKIIAAIDQDRGIGFNGKLLIKIPHDMKHFKELTTDKTVIMGRETFDSLPDGKALNNRRNIVLTRNEEFSADDVTVCHSIDELFDLLDQLDDDGISSDDMFVVGGAAIYEQLIPYCDTIYLTKVEKTFEADRHFPELDSEEWDEVIMDSASHIVGDELILYSICKYTRKE